MAPRGHDIIAFPRANSLPEGCVPDRKKLSAVVCPQITPVHSRNPACSHASAYATGLLEHHDISPTLLQPQGSGQPSHSRADNEDNRRAHKAVRIGVWGSDEARTAGQAVPLHWPVQRRRFRAKIA